MNTICRIIGLVAFVSPLLASPLLPLKTETPRDTMKSFMEYMEKYKVAKEEQVGKRALNSATRLLDTSEFSAISREERAQETAIFLKEVIDRVILIDLEKIPNNSNLGKWRLKDTDITIVKITNGERSGEYLFSKSTVERAKEFYELVKHLDYLQGSGKGANYKANIFEDSFPPWLNQKWVLYANWQWIGLFLLLLLGLLIEKISVIFLKPVQAIALKSKSDWDDKIYASIRSPFGWVLANVFWLASLPLLGFEGLAKSFLFLLVKLLLSTSLIYAAYKLVDILAEYLERKSKNTEFPLDDQLVPLIHRALKIFTLIFGVLIAMQNFGVNVMSLLAGLGLGGLAFALAAKDALSNLFGSIMILSDKPFKIGDWITVGNVDGNVESIGFRSTRVRTFYNSLISIPNSILANTNIDNMGRRTYRRIKANLGLTYSTKSESLEAFLEGTKHILKANPYIVQDNYHIVFSSYGDFSLNVLLYCHLDVKDWSEELIQRQNIYFEILRLAEKLGVDFAYPSQSLYIESTPDAPKNTETKSLEELKNIAKSYSKGGVNSRPEGLGIFTPRSKEVNNTET